jgi:hypothetical protein
MSGGAVTNLVIGLVVLVLVVSRQLTTRRLRENYQLLIILAVIGVVQFVAFLNGHPHHDGAIVAAVVGSLVLAAALWVVALAAHLGYDYLVAGHVTGKNGGNVGDATVVLYLAVSLAVQRYIMLARAARQDAAGQIPSSEPKVPLR